MPCSDLRIESEIISEKLAEKNRLLYKIDFLEAALCGAMKIVDKHKEKVDCINAGIDPAELKRWWYNHKRRDARKLNKVI